MKFTVGSVITFKAGRLFVTVEFVAEDAVRGRFFVEWPDGSPVPEMGDRWVLMPEGAA